MINMCLTFAEDAEGDIQLPFWGTVLDGAKLGGIPLGKANFLHLGSSLGLDLYLDGSQSMNAKQTCCCFSWFCDIEPLEKVVGKTTDEVKKSLVAYVFLPLNICLCCFMFCYIVILLLVL